MHVCASFSPTAEYRGFRQILLLLKTVQLEQLDSLAAATGGPRMELLREAVDDFLAKHFAGALEPEPRPQGQPGGARAQFERSLKRAVLAEQRRLQAGFQEQLQRELERATAERASKLAAREAAMNAREEELLQCAERLRLQRCSGDEHMTLEEYRLVLGCLHPDQPDRSAARLGHAFGIFKRLRP
jgi:hypothetical protein